MKNVIHKHDEESVFTTAEKAIFNFEKTAPMSYSGGVFSKTNLGLSPKAKFRFFIVFVHLLLFFLVSPILGPSQKVYAHSKRSLPEIRLHRIPYADEAQIVRKVFELKIPGYPEVYNPSIVKFSDGFILSFRYDNVLLHKAFVGLVRLDKDFKVIGKPVLADKFHDLEDARLFWYNDKLFATASRVLCKKPAACRIALSRINVKHLTFSSVVNLEYYPHVIEKNWVPLVQTDENGVEQLYYIYNHNPFHVLRVSSTDLGAIEHAFLSEKKKRIGWEKKWGQIRGGTPCLSLGAEQLAFFHSSFFAHGRQWWVIGAMTFENKPPFTITKISPTPLIAHGMYTTLIARRLGKRKFRVAFPGGFVEAQYMERPVFCVVYGENDSGIKVLVVDKEQVLSSLKNY